MDGRAFSDCCSPTFLTGIFLNQKILLLLAYINDQDMKQCNDTRGKAGDFQTRMSVRAYNMQTHCSIAGKKKGIGVWVEEREPLL